MYVLLALQRLVSRPSYEALGSLVVWGDEEWLEGERMKAAAKNRRVGRRFFRFGKGGIQGDDVDARRSELHAEVDRQVAESSVAAERWVRDGVKTFIKGQ